MSNIKYTFIKNFWSKQPMTESSTWEELCDLMEECSQIERKPEDKENTCPAIYPAIFKKPDGTDADGGDIIKKEIVNVHEYSSWWCVDLDHDITSEEILNLAEAMQVPYILYNTTQSTLESERLRLLFKLSRDVQLDEHLHLWHAIDEIFNGKVDPQTKNINRLYYVPATWEGALNLFLCKKDGTPLDIDEVLKSFPMNVQATPIRSAPSPKLCKLRQKLLNEDIGKDPKNKTLDAYICDDKFAEYVSIDQGKTAGLFGLMVSTVQRSILDGYQPSTNEITQVATDIDNRTGRYHQTTRPSTLTRYPTEIAQNVIASAQRNAMEMLAKEAIDTPEEPATALCEADSAIEGLERPTLSTVINSLPASLQGAIYGYNLSSNLPTELCLISALSATNFVAQKHYDVDPIEFPKRPLTEFFVALQERSGGKSSAYDTFLKPIQDSIPDLSREYKNAQEDYKMNMAIYKKKLKASEEGDLSPEEPSRPAFYDPFVSSPTLNGLIDHMELTNCAGIFTDEGTKFINSYDNRDTASGISLAGSLCDIWNGRELRKDTGLDKKRLFNRRCNVFILVQKTEAAKLVANDRYESQGLESRILTVDCPQWTRLELNEQTREYKKQGEALMQDYYNRISALMLMPPNTEEHDPCQLKPRLLKWNDDIHDIRIDWYNLCVGLYNGEVPQRASGLISKMYEHTCRLAGTICVYAGRDSISVQDWKAGEALMAFFIYQRITMGAIDDVDAMDKTVIAEAKLKEWISEHCDKPFTRSKLKQDGPYAFRKLGRDDRKKVIDELIADGFLKIDGKRLVNTYHTKRLKLAC